MKPPIDFRSYRHEFERVTGLRKDEGRMLEEQRRREKRGQQADDRAEELIDLSSMVIAASAEDIDAFRLDLDRYDRAMVEALVTNEQELIKAREKLEEMLAKAYVLPDGRRVFKAADGIHVFDENGEEIPPEQIDPDEIADFYTTWEERQAGIDAVEALEAERAAIILYQGKVDASRARLDDKNLTKDEIDAMKSELETAMPLAVRRKTLDLADADIADARTDFAYAATPVRTGQDPIHDLKQDLQ